MIEIATKSIKDILPNQQYHEILATLENQKQEFLNKLKENTDENGYVSTFDGFSFSSYVSSNVIKFSIPSKRIKAEPNGIYCIYEEYYQNLTIYHNTEVTNDRDKTYIIKKELSDIMVREEVYLGFDMHPKTGTIQKVHIAQHSFNGANSKFFKTLIGFLKNEEEINLESVKKSFKLAAKSEVNRNRHKYYFDSSKQYTETHSEAFFNTENDALFYQPLLDYYSKRLNKYREDDATDEFVQKYYSLLNEHYKDKESVYLNNYIISLLKDDKYVYFSYIYRKRRLEKPNLLAQDYFNIQNLYVLEPNSFNIIKKYVSEKHKMLNTQVLKEATGSRNTFGSRYNLKEIDSEGIQIFLNMINHKECPKIHSSYDYSDTKDQERFFYEIKSPELLKIALEFGIPFSNIVLLEKSHININLEKYLIAVSNVKGFDLIYKKQTKLYDLFPFTKSWIRKLNEYNFFSDVNLQFYLPFFFELSTKNISPSEAFDFYNQIENNFYQNDMTNPNNTSYFFRKAQRFERIIQLKEKYAPNKSLRSFIDYLVSVQQTEFIENLNGILTTYEDTMRFSEDLEVDIKIFPSPLTIEHNKVAYFHRKYKSEIDKKKIEQNARVDLEYNDEEFLIKACSSSTQLLEEGTELNHCVGSYSSRITNNESDILFLRKKENEDKPYVTLEVKDNKLVQIQGKAGKRSSFSSKVQEFLHSWLEEKELYNSVL